MPPAPAGPGPQARRACARGSPRRGPFLPETRRRGHRPAVAHGPCSAVRTAAASRKAQRGRGGGVRVGHGRGDVARSPDPLRWRGGQWRLVRSPAQVLDSRGRPRPRGTDGLRPANGARRPGCDSDRCSLAMRVVATAGHVDHGKSTLVKALTGEDPDRWPEEKARGLTIDLGFAATALPSGREIAFVDVPGHGRLVKNMLAGVGSVDACLFVVDAAEGWKEQSEEHLRILEIVGVRAGVVALTKVGLVDDERSQLAALEVQERLAGTFLADAEGGEGDVPARIGVDGLRQSLDRLVARVPASPDLGRSRLWVDRSFSVQGFGTVVTGKLTGGSMTVGQEVVIDPGGHHGRTRSPQSPRSKLVEASPGRRLAVNVSGLARSDARRGQVLVQPGQWHLTTTFDATLDVLSGVDHPVGHRGAYVVYIGSGEFPARLRLIGSHDVRPGEAGTARFLLKTTAGIPLAPGDRYVLRESGRFETVGGVEVLDVEPVVPPGRAQPSRSIARVISERGWVEADHLFRITGQRVEPTVGRWVVDPSVLTAAGADLIGQCRAAG